LEKITLKVKRTKDSNLPLPVYETDGSAGMDLRASLDGDVILEPGEIKLISTGIAISIPMGYEGQIRPRSGLAFKHGIGMVNSPGTIDSDYRGEVRIIMINYGKEPFTIKHGDRIAQLIIARICNAVIEEVFELDSTKRGQGGFGHSGIE
jgi:dUTP pyrophosphatase